ncbi:protein DpdD [uncultured Jatrophihabitans sp.]|uniref:protein DpdD n=1 Tax=uncultured Jatrophihabitans sp. TaxID=1610747 RepID=UPI0035C9C2DC
MTVAPAESFLSRFFAPPNTTWPNTDPQHPAAKTLAPFLDALSKRGECPLVLPRREASGPAAAYYVICWDTAHAGRMRPMLEAAVAHHWCPFDGRVATLKAKDPIDAAILDLFGPGTTYLLRPTPQTAGPAYAAIRRLVESLGDQPLRRPNLARPIGRMLREFDLALANGSAETSADLLREIEGFGGISHENLAYLQIRRLARLGQDRALLTHGSLPTIVYSEPPLLVREAVLAAWARANLILPLRAADLPNAVAALSAAQPDVAMLVDARLTNASDPDALAVGAVAAVARGDADLATAIAATGTISPDVFSERHQHVAAPLSDEQSATVESESDVTADVEPSDTDAEAGVITVEQPPSPDSWLTWTEQLNTPHASEITLDQAQEWAPVWTVDTEFADAIDALPQMAIDTLLSSVATFLDADDFNRPAMKTAAALLSHYLIAERFGPNDLGAICALLEIVLRAAPPVALYRGTLEDLRSYAPQWVAASTAARVLDIADVVASGPHSDHDARTAFVAALLFPLHHLRHRLSPALRRLASLVASDVNLALAWDEPDVSEGSESGTSNKVFSGQVLLYSLDEGCLARAEKTAGLQWPSMRVHISSDKVGNAALRQHSRNADLIVLATRRAAHAATGFITDAASGALVRYADGSGSASMIRAIESGVAELVD